MRNNKIRDTAKTRHQIALFSALADPTRLRLVHILCHQEPPGSRCVNNLSQVLGISQPAVSQHLRVLKSVGLVIGERRGFRMHYKIDPAGFTRCQEILSGALRFEESTSSDDCPEGCHQP